MDNKEYSIVASAEAFETLSSKLYTNPVAAVIRELSSNAQDSHVMAGNKNKPFKLHIPTEDERFFEIRDYGLGMSDDFVMSVFTTYFASTKNDSEDQIGAFGLGSKSPYSLTDNYNVISFYDGKKTTYLMSKKDGCPVVEKISEEETDEPNGLDINFSLRDHWEYDTEERFKREAYKFFSKSKFQPDWNLMLKDDQLKELALSKNYYNNDTALLNFEDNSFLRYDYYCSKISVNVAGVVFDVSNDRIKNLPYMFYSLNIMANKNDVTVTPSRESLHYDDKTIVFINKKIDEISKNKIEEISQKIKNEELDFFTLRSLASCSASDGLDEQAVTSLLKVFDPSTFYVDGRSVRRRNITNEPYRSENYKKVVGLLDLTGCKNAQLNTIKTTMEEDVYEPKISSKTFCDRVKFFFDEKGADSSDERIILVPLEGQEERAKEMLGDCASPFIYADCVSKKKNEETKKKRGFITQSTILFDNYEDTSGYSRANSDPSLREDELPLVIDNEHIGSFTKYIPYLKRFKPDIKIALRVCKEQYSIKNICSQFQCENAIDWAMKVIKENAASLKEDIKANSLNDKLEIFGVDASYYDDDVMKQIQEIDTSKLDKTSIDFLKDIQYVYDNRELIDNHSILKKMFAEEYNSYQLSINKDNYPLLKYVYFGRLCNDDIASCLKTILGYVSLINKNNLQKNV